MSQQLFTVSHSAVAKPGLANAKTFQTQTGTKPAMAQFGCQPKASQAAQFKMSLDGTTRAEAVSMGTFTSQASSSFSGLQKFESTPAMDSEAKFTQASQTPRSNGLKMSMSDMPKSSQISSNFAGSSFTNDFHGQSKINTTSRTTQPTMMLGQNADSFTVKGKGMSVNKNHFDNSFSRSSVVMQATAEKGELKKVVQKTLPYPMNGLEPVISENLMNYHYGKHHVAYVNNLNGMMEKAAQALENGDFNSYVDLSQNIKFNGGGHLNHEFFWESLSPTNHRGGKELASGKLHDMIKANFGDVASFKTKFSGVAAAIQGSGWAWLCYSKQTQQLEIMTSGNQDRICPGTHVPLLNMDVWEHAYYLDYQNARPKFLEEVWQIVNWNKMEERLTAALA